MPFDQAPAFRRKIALATDFELLSKPLIIIKTTG